MTRTQRALRRLNATLRKLELDQSRVARRHARTKVFGALRTLGNAIRAEYPTIIKPEPPLDQSLEARAERCTRSGFKRTILGVLRANGIPYDNEIAQRITCEAIEGNGRAIPLVVPRSCSTSYKHANTCTFVGYPGEINVYIPAVPDHASIWIDLFETLALFGGVSRRTDRAVCRLMLKMLRRVEALHREKAA